MSSIPAAAARTLSLFTPPYDDLVPCEPGIIQTLTDVDHWKGAALVWQLRSGAHCMDEFNALRYKTPALPLVVLLPAAAEVLGVADMLPMIRSLAPRLILPHGLIDTAYRLREVLVLPPRSLAAAVTELLISKGILKRRRPIREFQRIVELAPDTHTISALARRMYTSRRTLGRHFLDSGLPVPSHCLQFARLLHVAVRLQSEEAPVFRVASRFGYPDGFTMSNQMKRLTGHRPSEVRELIGWEWIVESWLKREGV